MKLWRKLLAAVTAGTICLGSIGAMLSVSAETELDSSTVSENSTEVKASKGAHTHYYGETASDPDGCSGWRGYTVSNDGKYGYTMMGDSQACQYAIDHGYVPNEGVFQLDGFGSELTQLQQQQQKLLPKQPPKRLPLPPSRVSRPRKRAVWTRVILTAAAVWIRQMCSTPCCTSPILR